MGLGRWRVLLPGLWAGWLLAVALVATATPFAVLVAADAGRVVNRVLATEAYSALVLGVLILVLERLAARQAVLRHEGSQFSLEMALALASLFCTVAGYFAIQPLMAGAKAGQRGLSFGQLHTLSAAFYIVKTGLVLSLAWRASGRVSQPLSSSRS